MTSGVTLSGQIGNDEAPIISGAIKYTKKSTQVGNAFSLLDCDYEFSTEVKVNKDFEITLPTKYVNVTVNVSECVDLLQKIGNKIDKMIEEKK